MDERSTEEIEARLRATDLERAELIDKLRERKEKERKAHRLSTLGGCELPKSPEEKVKLFASMPCSRRDVFPKYWENHDGTRKGYSPVCERVWDGGRRLKATEIFEKYVACKFEYLSEEVIKGDLMGRHTIGVYSIRSDDSCLFLAADFDGEGWQEEARSRVYGSSNR